jgi:23S rRNA (uracil1939-C5)-methyltransferase
MDSQSEIGKLESLAPDSATPEERPSNAAHCCPNKEVCGSCSWSNTPYVDQLQQKRNLVNQLIAEAGLPYRVEEIVPSPRTHHYRNRMDFVIDFEGRVGLRQKGKWWRVIDDHHCFISDEQIEVTFDLVRTWVRESGLSYFDRKRHTGLLRFALIRSSVLGETLVDIITSVPQEEEKQSLLLSLAQLAQQSQISTLVWSSNSSVADVSHGEIQAVVKGSGFLHEEILGVKYRISPHSFFQTNSHTAAILVTTIRGWIKQSATKSLLDLYCGTGFFAVSFAADCERVYGVEAFAEAIVDARFNAEANGRDIQFEVCASERFDWSRFKAEAVIVDPPRGGMDEKVTEELLRARPPRIFYVSCNYKHFVKDLSRLHPHYEMRQQLLVDQFPHTPHVELLAWLERREDT